MRLIVVSGLAGAGKSVVLDTLEDLGYHCIDNFPITLLRDLSAATLTRQGLDFDRLALGIDSRSGASQLTDLSTRIDNLRRGGVDIALIYVHADPDTILQRYSETRRRHPLSDDRNTLNEAVAADRRLMDPISQHADIRIDTTRTNIHELRDIVRNRVDANADDAMTIALQSFGFKHGVPSGVDFVFDARCLINPHWNPELRDYTGLDTAIADHLWADANTRAYFADLTHFLDRWLPRFADSDRTYVTIAVGCTGGRHRSVFLVEKLAEHLRAKYPATLVRHNEIK